MTRQKEGMWRTIVTISVGLLLGVGAFTWVRQPLPLPGQQVQTTSHDDLRLVKLEQAVRALTQAVQSSQARVVQPEPARVAAPVNSEVSRSDLAQIIRDEVRHAVAEANPEAQRVREEAIAEAQILNTPENKAAYQNASSVVQTAVVTKRWTEEDKETFRDAFGQLTNNQRMELMNILAPAINNGEVKVEVTGPLF
ncbi:MAG: hypothetical protein AB7G75_17535 [Candidatus Binatia bacterium]